MKPKRIRLRREKGWRKPEGAIVVARPSKWGNPIRVGSECQISAHGEDGLSYEFGRILVTPEIAVAIYRADLEASLMKPDWPNVHPEDWPSGSSVSLILRSCVATTSAVGALKTSRATPTCCWSWRTDDCDD